MQRDTARRPLVVAGIWLGLSLGGFFDGIVFHQILQWHHMLTGAGYPATTVPDLEVNTLADGLFHAATYSMLVVGLSLLWRAGRRRDVPWSGTTLLGSVLLGAGLFNLVEGIVNHHVLGIHHVRQGPGQLAWDLGFLLSGAILAGIGSLLIRSSR